MILYLGFIVALIIHFRKRQDKVFQVWDVFPLSFGREVTFLNYHVVATLTIPIGNCVRYLISTLLLGKPCAATLLRRVCTMSPATGLAGNQDHNGNINPISVFWWFNPGLYRVIFKISYVFFIKKVIYVSHEVKREEFYQKVKIINTHLEKLGSLGK